MTKRVLLGFLLLLLSLPLHAVQVEGLYSASVSVANQSQKVRSAGIGAALNQVVQKVSGRRSTSNNAQLKAALSNVGSYVEQFQYKKRDKKAGYWLIVRFQKAALDRTLQQFNVPIWGGNRPDVLLWLAVDDGKRRYLVNPDLAGGVAAVIKQGAADAGLAVTLPLLDLAGQKALSFNDVWAGFPDQILRASQRYSVKQVMFGRLLKRAGRWEINWTLMSETGRQEGREQSNKISIALRQSLAQVAENLANIYAPYGATGVASSQLKMQIGGVQDLAEFVRVTSYLSSLDMVKSLAWGSVVDSMVTLEVEISGEVAVLKDIISLNKMLTLDASPRTIVPVQMDANGFALQLSEQVIYYRAN